jgi:two-component system sensor histidine kinase DesK
MRARSFVRRLGAVAWILMLGLPLAGTFETRGVGGVRLAVTCGLVLLLAALYLGYRLLRDSKRPGLPLAQLGILSALILGISAALVFIGGPNFDFAFVYALWPLMETPRTRGLALPGVVAVAVAVGWLDGITFGELAAVVLVLLGFGTVIASILGLVEANVALEHARQEEARLAVTEERLRFARDLHELLGQSLSVIVLKAEVASRLLSAEPERAAEELEEIAQVTRRALQEVRDAVGGYRQPSLSSELVNARQALAAAGIACRERVELPSLPEEHEAALAWALREAVTNIVRHSTARACEIELGAGADQVTLKVHDDGTAAAAQEVSPGAHRGGHGLANLTERLSNLGGTVQAGPGPSGGFVLLASLPITGELEGTTRAERLSFEGPGAVVAP